MKSNTKLVVSLIKRVEVRLPINNTNRTIDLLEQDPITQQTVAAIIEISTHKLPDVINQLGLVLDSIPKVSFQGSTEVYIPLDVLQSQLFVIRLLSACLQHHWSWYKKHSIQISQETNRTEEARATGAYVNSSSNNSSTTLNVYEEADIYMDPPALDEKLTSFILNLMSRFIGQLHAIEERNEQFSSMTLDQLNDTSNIPLRLNSQSLEYVKDVYAAAGKVLYYISASNWSTFYTRIKSACSSPSTSSENSSIMSPDIRFLSFACLNVQKLQNILIDLSSFFISMKIQGKLLSAEMLRQAIWRWIQLKTTQFTDICTGKSNPLTGLEILFDICNVAADTSKKKAVLWPLQTLLLTLSPDFLSQAFFDSRGLQNRRTVFPRQLKKALDSPKTQEIAAICYIDLCKASTYISPQEDNVLHHIAEDIEGVLREKVWDFSRASAVESFPTSLGYTICHQTLLNDFFLSFLKINPTRTLDRFLPTLFEDDAPVLFKLAFVNACLQLTQDENRSSDWNPAIQSLYGTICAPLRRIFIHTVKHELSSGAAKSMVSTRKFLFPHHFQVLNSRY